MPAKVVEPKFKVGDSISWSSQAGGHTKLKQGVVTVVLGRSEDAYDALTKLGRDTKRCSVHASRRSILPRYLVEIYNTNPKIKVAHFYAPNVTVLNRTATLEHTVAVAIAGMIGQPPSSINFEESVEEPIKEAAGEASTVTKPAIEEPIEEPKTENEPAPASP